MHKHVRDDRCKSLIFHLPYFSHGTTLYLMWLFLSTFWSLINERMKLTHMKCREIILNWQSWMMGVIHSILSFFNFKTGLSSYCPSVIIQLECNPIINFVLLWVNILSYRWWFLFSCNWSFTVQVSTTSLRKKNFVSIQS